MRLLPPNTYGADPALRALLRAWLSPQTMEWAEPQLLELGRLASRPRLLRDAVLTIWEGTTNVLSLDALRTLARPGVADAFGAELERLDSPRRADLEHQLVRLAAEDQASAQRSARRLAFLAAEAWVAGLLREAAGRGRLEATVEELWALPTEPARGRRGAQPDHFDLLVDGAA